MDALWFIYNWAITSPFVIFFLIYLEERAKWKYFVEEVATSTKGTHQKSIDEKYITADYVKLALHWMLPLFTLLALIKLVIAPISALALLFGFDLQAIAGDWFLLAPVLDLAWIYLAISQARIPASWNPWR